MCAKNVCPREVLEWNVCNRVQKWGGCVCVCVIESCVKLLWVKVRVYVSACMCVGVDDGVEQRRHVHNEDGEALGSHNNNMRVSGG